METMKTVVATTTFISKNNLIVGVLCIDNENTGYLDYVSPFENTSVDYEYYKSEIDEIHIKAIRYCDRHGVNLDKY